MPTLVDTVVCAASLSYSAAAPSGVQGDSRGNDGQFDGGYDEKILQNPVENLRQKGGE